MSFFKKLFGGKKKNKDVSAIDSCQKVEETEGLLKKKQEFIETKIAEETEIAKKNVSTNKRVALQALKRKKRYEAQLEQIFQTQMKLEDQRTNLENAGLNSSVLDAMKDAGKALKKANKNMDIDTVTNTMDDIAEINAQANEITDAITNIGISNADDDELERELAELKDQAKLDINRNPVLLPEVPNNELPPSDTKNDVKKSKDMAMAM